jgi:hypothetical protein
LVTNRPPAANDPVISLRDGKDGTVAARLRDAPPRSKAGVARQKLAQHLNTDEKGLHEFLAYLSLRLSRLEDELRDQARLSMYATGLRYDEEALALGLSIVRAWVTDGKRKLSGKEIRDAVQTLKRPGDLPAASLLIQAIDRDPMPETATIVLDWIDLFPGSEPRSRRRPREDSLWNSKFRSELKEAAGMLRAQGHRRVLVRGDMRLPSWFAAGVELGRTAGFEVVSYQQGVPWASDGNVGEFPVTVSADREVGSGAELCLGICLSADLSEDVFHFLQKSVPGTGRLISIFPKAGPSNVAIRSDAAARAWALNTRDLVRTLVRKYRATTIHLFLAVPHGAALLLGHLWDRMPMTQLYEDLGPVGGYCPSFSIPN